MKRKILIILLAVVCATSLVLAACTEPHEHEYSRSWTYDDTYHWHIATCEHFEEIGDKAEHTYTNGICSVCGYEGEGFSWKISSSSSVTSNAKVLPPVPEDPAEDPSIQIHYYRANSADYTSWGFWLWSKMDEDCVINGNVDSLNEPPYGWPLNYQDDDGAVAIYTLEELGWVDGEDVMLGFIAKKMESSWTKDAYEADRFWNLSAATKDSNNYYHLYIVSGVGQMFDNKQDFIREGQQLQQNLQYGISAEFTDVNRLTVTTNSPVKNVKLYEGTTLLAQADTTSAKDIAYKFENGKVMDFDKEYKVKVTFAADNAERECAVSIVKLYNNVDFDTAYYYDGELGAIYSPTSTTFKVWSPVSSKIVLNLYTEGNGGTAYETHEMVKGDKGVFSFTVNKDLETNYYTYTVYNASYPQGREIVDPYAKSAGLNGVRGQIVDFSKTNPTGWDSVTPKSYDANELVVWETHVADVTSSSTWNGPQNLSKKFLGMIERGTTYQGVKTGFDHIVELGVNAVQLVPIFDQAGNDELNKAFNWGYNPLNYNVLEGSYSTDPTDGYARIKEFKQLVQAFNGANINIIMDVVYNHVSAAIGSNFDVLMPGYYYRYTQSGTLSNGSGCGNETASERSMFRKFMIDSVCFWAKEYKLGGFRFDLMGLHDIETMNLLTAELKKINPSIIVYGEPWTGGGTTMKASEQATQANGDKYVGYGQFNDQMRDALIMGGLKAATDKGWATGGNPSVSTIVDGLKGFTNSKIQDLYKTVNYVTCHDNYTLHDRVIATSQFGPAASVFSGDITLTAEQQATIKKMAMLANSVVFSSNGVNFMLAGEEFLRSKAAGGAVGDEIHNSYESSYEVNELDYALKVENADMFANYQKLIAFKKMFVKDFGLNSNEQVSAKYKVEGNGSVITITITAKNNTVWKIVHANGGVAAGTTADFAGYTLYLDTLNVNSAALGTVTIQPYQTIIASKAA